MRWLDILACYAASVALNGILPANLGTLVMLLMFTTIIAGATFAAILGAYAVQKIFYTLIGDFVYLYLFLSVGGSFDIKFAFVHDASVGDRSSCSSAAPSSSSSLRAGCGREVVKWWDQAKDGGGDPCASAGVLRPRLPAVAPELVRQPRRDGGLPGGVRHPCQLPHVDADLRRQLDRERDVGDTRRRRRHAGVQRRLPRAGSRPPTQATAYSVAQQLVTTSWNIIFAIVLVVWAFGWTGGRQLVTTSYVDAKEKAAEQKAAHAARKEAKQAAKEQPEHA